MDWLAEDFYFYFRFADNFFSGLIPYRDYNLDQFPGAFLVYLLPRIFTSDYGSYVLLFALLVGSLFFIQLSILLEKWRKKRKEIVWAVFLILSGTLILPLALMRFDGVPTILTLAALLFLLKNASLKAEVFLALGTVVKIFPINLLPLFVIFRWQKQGKEGVFKGVLVYFLTIVLFLTPFLLAGGIKGLLYTFNYHLVRLIEIESLPASVLLAAFLMGQEVISLHNFGSWNVSLAGWDTGLKVVFLIFWLTSALFIYYWFYRKIKAQKSSAQQEFLLVKGSLIVILLFIAFNKVFSPQYLIWPLPFVFWFLLYTSRKTTIILGSLWCFVLLLTMTNLFCFKALTDFNETVILLQIFRNIFFLVFLGGVIVSSLKAPLVSEKKNKK